jgi:hypothetical protein
LRHKASQTSIRPATRVFSSEIDTGSREENASKTKSWSPVSIQSERKRLWQAVEEAGSEAFRIVILWGPDLIGGTMRGSDEQSGSLFSYVDLEARVRVDHPLQVIRDLANAALEEVSGWIKSPAGLAKVKLGGRDRVDAGFVLALAAYNLIRLPKLLTAPA